MKGCVSEHWLKLMNYVPKEEPNTEQIDDEFLDLHELQEFNLVGDYLKLLAPEELEEEKNKIKKGKESHKAIVAFQD